MQYTYLIAADHSAPGDSFTEAPARTQRTPSLDSVSVPDQSSQSAPSLHGTRLPTPDRETAALSGRHVRPCAQTSSHRHVVNMTLTSAATARLQREASVRGPRLATAPERPGGSRAYRVSNAGGQRETASIILRASRLGRVPSFRVAVVAGVGCLGRDRKSFHCGPNLPHLGKSSL